MKFHFTKHAKEKFQKVRKAGFPITQSKVKQIVLHPLQVEEHSPGVFIATTLLDEKHVFRVVYKHQDDIMVIITFYPGRRKTYGI